MHNITLFISGFVAGYCTSVLILFCWFLRKNRLSIIRHALNKTWKLEEAKRKLP